MYQVKTSVFHYLYELSVTISSGITFPAFFFFFGKLIYCGICFLQDYLRIIPFCSLVALK